VRAKAENRLIAATLAVAGHPLGFRKIASGLIVASLAIGLCVLAFYYGASVVSVSQLKHKLDISPQESLSSIDYAIHTLDSAVTIVNRMLLIIVAVLAYMIFLRKLPNILGLAQDNTEQSQSQKPSDGGGGS
jgi:hypothetical protein